jgi:hypothetical protein
VLELGLSKKQALSTPLQLGLRLRSGRQKAPGRWHRAAESAGYLRLSARLNRRAFPRATKSTGEFLAHHVGITGERESGFEIDDAVADQAGDLSVEVLHTLR